MNSRLINKIIIHCTATPELRAVSLAQVDSWHRQRGFSCIGYHYLIGLDGELDVGRPIAAIGAHTQGQNNNSIGICYVGGLDRQGKPKDTRNDLQKAALLKLVKEIKTKYPRASLHGHYEFANKACPCFDVSQWAKENNL